MMNVINKKYFLIGLLAAFTLLSCEKNDPLEEMADVGNFSASIYFVPISPISSAGSNIETEIEYWTVGDEYKEMGLYHEVMRLEEYEFTMKDVPFNYSFEAEEELMPATLYKAVDYDFTDWVPAKNAYVITPEYTVDQNFKKVRKNQNNTSLTDFVNGFSQELKEDLFESMAVQLTRLQLKDLLVIVHEVITESEFENYYENESLTDAGKTQVVNKLKAIGAYNLIGSKYSLESTHQVGLTFRIVNGFDETSESATRFFNVN